MTRNGKIARLPRKIRDELNRRLDNNEQGTRLLEWLNSLPAVKKVLKADFDGQPIAHDNLTHWKKGGFQDWRIEQQTLAVLQNVKDRGDGLSQVPPLELTDTINTLLTANFAVAVNRTDIINAGKDGESLERLSRMLRDLDRLRRRNQADQRIEIERQWLELEREKFDCQYPLTETQETQETEPAQEPPLALTPQEKAQMLKEIFDDGYNGQPNDPNPHNPTNPSTPPTAE